jgi:hypothetical protein
MPDARCPGVRIVKHLMLLRKAKVFVPGKLFQAGLKILNKAQAHPLWALGRINGAASLVRNAFSPKRHLSEFLTNDPSYSVISRNRNWPISKTKN